MLSPEEGQFMSDSRMFVLLLLTAALVPIVLLAIVRAAAWALPPSLRWAAAFELRHRFALGLLEAVVWLLWFARSFAWPDDPYFSNWLIRVLDLLLAAAALSRAIRHKRAHPVAPAPA